MDPLRPEPSDPVTRAPPPRTVSEPAPASPTLTLPAPFHLLKESLIFIAPLDPAFVPRTSSPEAPAVPPPWSVRTPLPPEPTRTAVPEVTWRVAPVSMVMEPLGMHRESTERAPWLAALTTPPSTSNWPRAVTLDDESETVRTPVEPIALP